MNSKKKLLSFITAVAISASAFTGLIVPASAADGDNLLTDGGFETKTLKAQTVNDDWKVLDKTVWYSFANGSSASVAVATDDKNAGDKSVKLVQGGVAQRVTLEADKTYELSAMIKGSGSVNMKFYDGKAEWPIGDANKVAEKTVTATDTWTKSTVELENSKAQDYVVYIENYENAGASCYVDEVTLAVKASEEATEAPTEAPTTAPTEEPDATEAPTAAPAATEAPTAAPDATAVPAATDEPDATQAPAVTEKPDTTQVPTVTEKPDVTEAPAPVVTEKPIADGDELINMSFDDGTLKSTAAYGKAEGAPKFVTEDGKKCIQFDGTAATALKLTKADGTSLLAGIDELTVSFKIKTTVNNAASWWFYTAPSTSAQTYLSEKYIGAATLPQDENFPTRFGFECYNNNAVSARPAQCTAEFSANEWYTVNVIYGKDGTVKATVNGKEYTQATGVNIAQMLGSAPVTYIGQANWGSGEYATGFMDDLVIYKGAKEPEAEPTTEPTKTEAPEVTPTPTPTTKPVTTDKPEPPVGGASISYSADTGKISINYTEDKAAKLIVAKYDNGALKSVKSADVTLKNGTVEVDAAANGITVDEGDILMVWNSLEGMLPLMSAVKYVKPTPTPKPTINPANLYYTLDFAKETAGTVADKNAVGEFLTTLTLSDGTKWISQYDAADMKINNDSADEIGTYFNFGNTTGKGARTAYYSLGEGAKKLENNKAILDFDLRMDANNAGDHIVITDNGAKDPPIGNGNYDSSYIFALYQVDKDTLGLNTVDGKDPAATSEGYTAGKWAHVKAFMDFDLHAVKVTVTSLDGATTYIDEVVPMNASEAKSIDKIFICTQRNVNANVGVDNVVVSKAEGSIGVYYITTFEVEGKATNITVKENESVAAEDVPSVEKTGHIFDGWLVNDTETVMSTEEVLAAKATANVKYTAKYHRDPEYIEPMVGLEFSEFPTGGIPTAGADADTAASNPITVKIVGEIGGNLTETPDERVKDLDVKWEFLGFRHIASKAAEGNAAATTDAADSNEYCDSYAKVVPGEKKTSVDFQLKSQAFNFYGAVKATVTYNGETKTIIKPMSILPDKTTDASTILPKAGYKYVQDANNYSDDMVDYQLTTSASNKEATDITAGDWAAYGGNSGRGLYIAKDEKTNKKVYKLKSTGTNSSSFAVNKLDSAPKGQVIIAQDIKFYNANSTILFKQDNPVTWKDSSTTLSLDFTGSSVKLNAGEEIANITAGEWYHIVLAADVTSKLCLAKIYDMEGKLLGESDVMPFSQAGATAPVYLCYRTPDNAQGELDFNNVKMYVPSIDESKFTITAADETLSVPKAGAAAVSTTLSASALSTEGYDMIGNAKWEIDSSVSDTANLDITPDKSNSHLATFTVKAGAPAGEIPINVTISGVTKQIKINLTSSQDSVQFTKSTSSISIPLEAGASDTYDYAAKVVGPKSDTDDTPTDIAGKTVTLAVYDKNNTNELKTLPAGITFDAATGKLTVTDKASATTLYIRAMSTNRKDEAISKAVKVTIHGLAFDFGTDAEGAVVEGYTAVTPTTAYSDATGYGIEGGTPTAGGTASVDNADSDNLAGTFTFKAKVQKAKVYKVKINYFGKAVSEKVSADLTGVERSNTSQSTVEYTVPVIDDVLDLTFSGGNVASIVIEKVADKAKNLKPHIYTVGDSTIANNGSWAYVMANNYASYSQLPEIASFTNNGRGGKNLSTYYTGGEFIDRVLANVCPGDYVMIGDMGTNGMGNNFEESFNYYVDACEALGAKIILNSYSPHGAVGSYASGYDAATHTFNSYRQDAYDNIVRKIYEERTTKDGEKYDDKVVGFVDIGKMADAAFNAYVADYAKNGHADANAAAQAIITCFGDHNHYSNGPLAAELMIKGYGTGADAKGIVKSLYEIISADLAK